MASPRTAWARMDVLDPTPPGASWHPDPLAPEPRVRWWAGDHWTAWVAGSPVDAPTLSWQPEVGELPSPIRWGTPVLAVAAAPPLTIRPLDGPSAPSAAPAPLPAVAAATGTNGRPRRRRRHLALVAAVLPLLVAGAASAALLTPTPPRPVLARSAAYRDARAGFSLTYEQSWRVERANAGQGVQFLVGPVGAPGTALTTVSVTTGTGRGPLPAPADLARTVVASFRPELPGLHLTGADSTTLSGNPALQLRFADSSTSPPTSVEEVTGRTVDDRPLIVAVTVHDPRYAPNDVELRDFLASIVT